MCGLTGFARHPKAPNLELALAIFTEMLEKNERRGHHATGVAAVGGSKPFLLKKAVEASKFTKSDPYRDRVMSLAGNTPIVLGHTRHATHANAHDDEAAHPFHIGKVVGAHNGVIHNWREVEHKVFAKNDGHVRWINDSQAAFAVLDKWKDPVKALDALDGWWALTWTRDKMFWVCRTGVEISGAYVPSMRTLFWASEINVLTRTLDAAGLKDGYDAWTFATGTVYRYDPAAFDEKGTNATKKDAPFRGLGAMNRGVRLGSSGRGDDVRRGGMVTRGELDRAGWGTGGFSTQRTVGTYPSGRSWDATNAREVEAPADPVSAAKRRTSSLGSVGEELGRLWDFVAKQNMRIAEVESDNEALRAEIEHLYAVMNEEYPRMFDRDDDEPGDDESALDYIHRVQRESSPASPYAEAPTCGGAEQLPLLSVREVDAPPAGAKCNECDLGHEAGRLLTVAAGEYVHEACVLVS